MVGNRYIEFSNYSDFVPCSNSKTLIRSFQSIWNWMVSEQILSVCLDLRLVCIVHKELEKGNSKIKAFANKIKVLAGQKQLIP